MVNNKQSERKTNMKLTNNSLIVALAGIALLAVANPVKAQYKPTGDDGITASPKVRAQLSELNAKAKSPLVGVGSMTCPKCKDEWVTLPNKQAKPAQFLLSHGVPTQKVARHLCAGCDTTITVEGLSKATRHSVVTHQCNSCGALTVACCDTIKGGDVATKGMERN